MPFLGHYKIRSVDGQLTVDKFCMNGKQFIGILSNNQKPLS